VTADGLVYDIHLNWTVAGTSIVIACLGIAVATVLYMKGTNPVPARLAERFKGFYTAAYHRFYLDEVWMFVTKRIIFGCISRPLAWFDRHVIDGAMNGMALVTQKVSWAIRGLQSGQVQQYAFIFLLGTLIVVLLLLLYV